MANNYPNYYQPQYGQSPTGFYPNYYYNNGAPVQTPVSPSVNTPQYSQPTYQPVQTAPALPLRGIAGRLVNDASEITVNEVPTDGSIAMFPKNDGTCIYTKQWNSDGTIKTICFVPEDNNEIPQELNTEKGKSIIERLETIEKMLAGVSASVANSNYYNRNRSKKENQHEQSNSKPCN